MDFRDFVTAHFSCKLDPKVYHTCEDKVEFHFHPPFPLPPPPRNTLNAFWAVTGSGSHASKVRVIRYPKTQKSIIKYVWRFFFVFVFFLLIISFVFYNSGMYNNTREPVLCLTCIEAWWPTWLLKIRQHFHWYPMCPLNLTKKALRAW